MDKRRHRGAHPEDRLNFAPERTPYLRRATAELSWLRERGYADISSLKLVGDRYELTLRQRMAIKRSACPDPVGSLRCQKELTVEQLAGSNLLIDGYNLLTTLETALSGGVILVGRDGAYRDIAGIHGTYRTIEETIPAIELAGNFLAQIAPLQVTWYLDRPVSNSGRLRGLILDIAQRAGWPWQVEIAPDPDQILSQTPEPVATSDSVILDRCRNWCNLAAAIIREKIPTAWVIDLSRQTRR